MLHPPGASTRVVLSMGDFPKPILWLSHFKSLREDFLTTYLEYSEPPLLICFLLCTCHSLWFFSSLLCYLTERIFPTERLLHENGDQDSPAYSWVPSAEHRQGHLETARWICVD